MTPYYSDDAVTIYHGDCREVLPVMGPSAFDSAVTDPPYGTSAEYVAGDDQYPHDVIPIGNQCIAFGSARRLHSDLKAFSEQPDRVMSWVPALNISKASSGGILYKWTPIYCWAINKVKQTDPPYGDVFAAHDGLVSSITKPVSLMIQLVGLVNGVVLDPFMGSGSTLVAAKTSGRKAIGIEIDERYCEIAARRMAQEVLNFGGVA